MSTHGQDRGLRSFVRSGSRICRRRISGANLHRERILSLKKEEVSIDRRAHDRKARDRSRILGSFQYKKGGGREGF